MGRRVGVLALVVVLAVAGLTGIATTASAAGAYAPVGSFDVATARFGKFVRLQEHTTDMTFSGWAADRDAPGTPVSVHVLAVNGWGGFPAGANLPRADVDRVVSWAGPNTGWSATIAADTIDVTRTICAYALNLPRDGTSTLLGCKNLGAPNRNDPVGSLDGAWASPGAVRLRGWAGDPDGYRTTRLRVYYDPRYPLRSEPVADLVADRPRADVKRAFPRLSDTTGFDLTLPITPGHQEICVLAQNTGPSGSRNLDLGCVEGTIPGSPAAGAHDPRGSFDAFQWVNGSGWHVSGWAYDPDAGGPVDVQVRSLATNEQQQSPYDRTYPFALTNLTTGVPRPSVQVKFPAAGPNAGFEGRAIKASSLPSPTVICVYALNVGPGASRLLGCRF